MTTTTESQIVAVPLDELEPADDNLRGPVGDENWPAASPESASSSRWSSCRWTVSLVVTALWRDTGAISPPPRLDWAPFRA